MQWTSDCTKALASTKERGDKKALKSLKKKQASLLSSRVVLVSLIFSVVVFVGSIFAALSGPFAFLLRSVAGPSPDQRLIFFFFVFPSHSLCSHIYCNGQLNNCRRLASLSCFVALKLNNSSFTKHDEYSFQISSSCLQISMLNKFSEMIRGNLTKIQRQKIVALVTIEVHARDVIEKMIKSGCGDVTAFEWLSQLRLYWDKVCVTPAIFTWVLKSNWLCVTSRCTIGLKNLAPFFHPI